MGKLLISLSVFLAPVFVLAQTTAQATQSWWEVALSELIGAAAYIASAVLITLIGVLVRKWKINVEKNVVEGVVKATIGTLEQKGKELVDEGKPLTTTAEKVKLASDLGQQMLTSVGFGKERAVKELNKVITEHFEKEEAAADKPAE